VRSSSATRIFISYCKKGVATTRPWLLQHAHTTAKLEKRGWWESKTSATIDASFGNLLLRCSGHHNHGHSDHGRLYLTGVVVTWERSSA